jgi:NitT/TauT family transport system ATP-binding protein
MLPPSRPPHPAQAGTPLRGTDAAAEGPPAASSDRSGVTVVIDGVRRVFDGQTVAVETLSLRIPAGQFLAILGPSGCGKSTLLRLIARLDRPTSGAVRVEDAATAVAESGAAAAGVGIAAAIGPGAAAAGPERARGGAGGGPSSSPAPSNPIAFVFQDAHLLPWRTVLHNAALPLELLGVSRAQRLAVAREELVQVGLGDALERYPAQLSGGMRMRVSLARALVTRPRLLLLDEPFAALDEITRQRLDEQLRGLYLARRMTVIFVTHSIPEATFLADRAVVLSRRPARIVLDAAIELPPQRTAQLRTDAGFARQMRALFAALQDA